MSKTDIIVLVVGFITAFGGWATSRASDKSNSIDQRGKNQTDLERTQDKSRVEMERDAYIRARNFDIETIARQDEEIKELRGEVEDLRAQVDSLRVELSTRPKGPPDDRNGP